MRCVVCGGEAIIEGMCLKCFLERNEISWIDDTIEIVKCPKCGSGRDVEDLIYENLRVHPSFEVEDVYIESLDGKRYVVRLVGNVEGRKVTDEKVVEFRVRYKTCERCARISGGYYEAVVQIRADGRDIEKEEIEKVREIIERTLESTDNPKAFVSKVVERKEGFDFYFGDKNLGRKVSREIVKALGGRLIESRKLHTRKDGRDVYRYTFAVRLPCYRVGDVVVDEGKICLVTGFGKGIRIEDLKRINLRNPKVIVRKEELERGVVVSVDDYTVEIASERGVFQALNTFNFRIGDEVCFFEYESKFYAIPYEGGKSSQGEG